MSWEAWRCGRFWCRFMAVRCKATNTAVTATFVIIFLLFCFWPVFLALSWTCSIVPLLARRRTCRSSHRTRRCRHMSDCSLAIRWSQTRIRPKIEAASVRLVEAHDVHWGRKVGCRVVAGVFGQHSVSADAWCRAPVLSELWVADFRFLESTLSAVFLVSTDSTWFYWFSWFYWFYLILLILLTLLILLILLILSWFVFLLFSSRLEGAQTQALSLITFHDGPIRKQIAHSGTLMTLHFRHTTRHRRHFRPSVVGLHRLEFSPSSRIHHLFDHRLEFRLW